MKVTFEGHEVDERLDGIYFLAEIDSDWNIVKVEPFKEESDMDLWEDFNAQRMLKKATDYLQDIVDDCGGEMETFMDHYVTDTTDAPESLHYIG